MIVANTKAPNQEVIAVSTAVAIVTIEITATIATWNMFKAKNVKLELLGKFRRDPNNF